jgi:hypothetical protein
MLYVMFVPLRFISPVTHLPVDTGHPYLLLGNPARDLTLL